MYTGIFYSSMPFEDDQKGACDATMVHFQVLATCEAELYGN